VAIISKPGRPELSEVLPALEKWLQQRNRAVVVDDASDGWQAGLFDRLFEVDEASDRIGLRLRPRDGAPLATSRAEVRSAGTTVGTVQLPPDGHPVVLMADHATLGGYPVGAVVITADLGRFAQTPAGTSFRFRAVPMAEAQAAVKKFAELLRTLPDRLRGIENFDLNIEALQDANVAGQAVSAVDAGTWQVQAPADMN